MNLEEETTNSSRFYSIINIQEKNLWMPGIFIPKFCLLGVGIRHFVNPGINDQPICVEGTFEKEHFNIFEKEHFLTEVHL